MSKNFPFRIIVSAIFIVLIVPMAIQDGMFMDGLIYASVSNNLSHGIGSFWFLTFSETFMTDYSEQLPLFFGVQSVFFKILGSSIYTERIFSFLMACITGFNIIKIWRLVYKDDNQKKQLEWIAIFLWITIPICFWSYINNVEETLMAVFSTAAVYFILKGLLCEPRVIMYMILGGVSIFCCSFCKGFQGLFPVVTVSLYWLFLKKITFKKMLWLSLFLLFVPLLIYSILLVNETSFQSLSNYFDNRIIRTFTNPNSSTTDNRFYLIYRLFTELIPALISVLIVFIVYRLKRKSVKVKHHLEYFGFFLSIGIAGSFPLIITHEQRGFYLVTTLPFFALSLALLAVPYVNPLIETINTKSKTFNFFRLSMISFLFIVIIFSSLQYGKTKRDKEKLHDVYLIGNSIPLKSTISVLPILMGDYALCGYFVRHFNISLDPDPSQYNEYYLKKKDSVVEIPKNYTKVDLNLKVYELLKKTTHKK